MAGEGVLLVSENGAEALFGALYEQIVPLIDGLRSVDEIVAALAGRVEAAKIWYVLMLLEQAGQIVEATPEIPARECAFWHGLEIDPASFQKARVRVSTIGAVDGAALVSALADLGIPVVTDDGRADIHLVVTDDYPIQHSGDLLADIMECRRRIETRGMEMLVLDQTRPDIGLPVVKVIVPGLRHFWQRFAPGRLYDVPVAMGWQISPSPEECLNPIAIFI